MIIPMRCFNCGYVLGDKWRWYQKRVAELRIQQGITAPVLIDGSVKPDMDKPTPERQAQDEMGVTRYCCRKTLLTHRDLIDKI